MCVAEDASGAMEVNRQRAVLQLKLNTTPQLSSSLHSHCTSSGIYGVGPKQNYKSHFTQWKGYCLFPGVKP